MVRDKRPAETNTSGHKGHREHRAQGHRDKRVQAELVGRQG